MFADTLSSSWTERSRRSWTTLTSFGLQALVAAVLLVLPLLRPMGLPSLRPLSTPIRLGTPMAEPAAHSPQRVANSAAPSTAPEIFLRQPSQIPRSLPAAGDDGPPQITSAGSSIAGSSIFGRQWGDWRGTPGTLGSAVTPVLPVPPKPVAAVLRISSISEGNPIRKVQPAYPPLARSARIQGAVVLQAVISRQGAIENLRVLTGHPMLVRAAIEAVSQWRYRPYVLNHEPVEVETQITVNFSLTGN